MKIKRIVIENFRSLEKVDLPVGERMSVIAGTNGSGKTTLLEALRLLFVFATPRSENDLQQAAAHIPGLENRGGSLDARAFLGSPDKPARIAVICEFSDEDVQKVRGGVDSIARRHLIANLGGGLRGEANLEARAETPEGQEEREKLSARITATINQQFESNSNKIPLQLTIDHREGVVGVSYPFTGAALTEIWKQPDYNLTPVSYFPADRALPATSFHLQFGQAEYQTHMNTHLIQPHQKYARLKQYIANRHLAGQNIGADIDLVLSTFLGRGRVFDGIKVDDTGRLVVGIRDTMTGKGYDMSDMSSGEKGAILTYLLMKRSMMPGGLILLDEPELHFHPTLQRKIVPFIIENVCDPLDVQVIACTHSPQVLTSAYFEDSTMLHRLYGSPTQVTEIQRVDRTAAQDAIEALGADPIATMCHEGILYLEGKSDLKIVEKGFFDRLGGYKIAVMYGRDEAEKNIEQLRTEDLHGKFVVQHAFLLDNDRRPVAVEDTEHVRVVQLRRYCIENYLIDPNVVYSVYKSERNKYESNIAKKNLGAGIEQMSRGEMATIIEMSAKEQLPFSVAKKVYQNSIAPPNSGFLNEYRDAGEDFETIALSIGQRLTEIRESLKEEKIADLTRGYGESCRNELEREKGRLDWAVRLDGKKTLECLWHRLKLRDDFSLPKSHFFERLIVESARERGAIWQELEAAIMRTLGRAD